MYAASAAAWAVTYAEQCRQPGAIASMILPSQVNLEAFETPPVLSGVLDAYDVDF